MIGQQRQLTQAELHAVARAVFGDDVKSWAFRCPNCGDIASVADFQAAGADPNRIGQECIGRYPHAGHGFVSVQATTRGCDYAAYGLIHGPWEIMFPAEEGKPQRSAWSFPLAKCCDMHNQHCEPPSELCCEWCTEIEHPKHAKGVRCVLELAAGETTA